MTKVPNGEEKLPKTEQGARTLQTDDRRTTDRRAIAYSELEREFTFAKTLDNFTLPQLCLNPLILSLFFTVDLAENL